MARIRVGSVQTDLPGQPQVQAPAAAFGPGGQGLAQAGEGLAQLGQRMQARNDSIIRVGEVDRGNTFLNETVQAASGLSLTDPDEYQAVVQRISDWEKESLERVRRTSSTDSAIAYTERAAVMRQQALGKIAALRVAQTHQQFRDVASSAVAPLIQQAYQGDDDFLGLADAINRELNEMQRGPDGSGVGAIDQNEFMNLKRQKLADLGSARIMGILDRATQSGDIMALQEAEDILDTTPGLAAALGSQGQMQHRRLIQSTRSSMLSTRDSQARAAMEADVRRGEGIVTTLSGQLQNAITSGVVQSPEQILARPGVANQVMEAVRLTGQSQEQVLSAIFAGAAGAATPVETGQAAGLQQLGQEQVLAGRAMPSFLDPSGGVRPEDTTRLQRMVSEALGGSVDVAGRVQGLEPEFARLVPGITATAERLLMDREAETVGEAVALSLSQADIPEQLSFAQLGENLETIGEQTDDVAARDAIEAVRLEPEYATGFGSALVNVWNQTLAQVFPQTFVPEVARARELQGLLVGDFIRAERRTEGRIAVWEQMRLSRIFTDPSVFRSGPQLREQLQSMDERLTAEISRQQEMLRANVPVQMKQDALVNIEALSTSRARVRQFNTELRDGSAQVPEMAEPRRMPTLGDAARTLEIQTMNLKQLQALDPSDLTREQLRQAEDRWQLLNRQRQ